MTVARTIDRRGDRVVELVPAVLAVAAEGAWVAVLYALVQAASGGSFVLGTVSMVLAAGLGLVAARVLGPRVGPRWPALTLALTLGGALAGWLADPAVIAAVADGSLSRALFTHPGGWLVGLAVLRGTAHARPQTSAAVLETLMTVGLPVLAVPVLLGGMLAAPRWDAFIAAATPSILLFVVSGTVALAVRRLDRVGTGAGFDWRRNRWWLVMVALLVVGAGALAIPASDVVGPLVRLAVGLLVVPLLLVGAIAGFGQVSRRAVISLLVVLVVLGLLVVVAGPAEAPPPDPAEGVGTGGGGTAGDLVIAAGGGGIVAILLVVAVLVLARLWMREALRGGDPAVPEERVIDAGWIESTVAPGRPGRRARRRPEPRGAAEAYLALLDDLEPREMVRRETGETPAEHARRLRAGGHGAAGLDLLAADYELVAFGERRLTAPEDRRGMARWRRLRITLGR